ncbi:MAG: uroporphyrinogen-III C-methyltransferase [Alphaproteobacteria bacterium]|nr:uroporphyrinogen-III C-methyltransferase [Alphaproteobacteria bacterium]
MARAGRVALVGAGPGDPELLTLRAARLLAEAEAVVYDRLVPQAIVERARPGAMRIDVGKGAGHHPVPQDTINALLLRLARSGRLVVRLKGGDPFTFGRGGEEAAYLVGHGIPCEVVPGVTSASGAAAALGIPLTHRGLATGVRYVTGHCRDDAPLDLDWSGLADPGTTLVVYMGLANIRRIACGLIEHGMPADLPAAAIARATQAEQRLVVAPLAGIADAAQALKDQGPVLFVIGRVVELAAVLGADASEIERAYA